MYENNHFSSYRYNNSVERSVFIYIISGNQVEFNYYNWIFKRFLSQMFNHSWSKISLWVPSSTFTSIQTRASYQVYHNPCPCHDKFPYITCPIVKILKSHIRFKTSKCQKVVPNICRSHSSYHYYENFMRNITEKSFSNYVWLHHLVVVNPVWYNNLSLLIYDKNPTFLYFWIL